MDPSWEAEPMSRIHFLLLSLFVLLFAGEIAMAQGSGQSKTAEKFLLLLKSAKYAEAEALMDAKMKAALGGDKLAQTWRSILTPLGQLKTLGSARESQLPGGYKVNLLLAEFERGKKDLQVAIDPQGAVCGFFVKEPEQVSVEPPYADRAKFTESKVKVGSAEFILDGTLSMPAGEGPFPGIVLVHGSGPHGQDEVVGGIKVFRDLAWGLASRGIAVLRYNKRSFQHAQKLVPLVDKLTLKEETIDDAVAALKTLKANARIDKNRTYILGHSLGGMAMPRIARDATDAAGFIIMAGSTRPLEDLIVEQTEYIYSLQGKKSAEQEKSIADLKEMAKKVKNPSLSSATPAKELPLGVPAAYWLDLRAHDPADEIKAVSQPLLILQGEKDYQVTSKDLERWKQSLAGRANVTIKTYPGLGHCFTRAGEKPGPSDYEKAQNVSVSVIDDIAGWVNKNK